MPAISEKYIKLLWSCIFALMLFPIDLNAQNSTSDSLINGFKGIWFELGQIYEYGDKYSGGLGTYTAKHRPMAIYDKASNRTYFVYGGTTSAEERHLLCMISFFDHTTGKLAKPVVVHDKKGVDDPHDNPSLLIDQEGFVWVFISGRGRGRPGFKYRSQNPYDINSFVQISEEEMTYPQPWYFAGKGYFHFFTKYTGLRELYYESSSDGTNWTSDKKLVSIKREQDENAGHYQISSRYKDKAGTFFNWHPNGNVDKRTNLYYIETPDFGKTWRTASGDTLSIPLQNVDSKSQVKEYYSQNKNVYLKDFTFDGTGNPVALYLVSSGHRPGPEDGERVWYTAAWNGSEWEIHEVCRSDHNYDMGSLYIEKDQWRVVAPTAVGPQKWGAGGDIEIWISDDKGLTWKKENRVTRNSEYNHSYVRRPVNAHSQFYFFWADGNPNEFSLSRLYYGNRKGAYWQMPYDDKTYNYMDTSDK